MTPKLARKTAVRDIDDLFEGKKPGHNAAWAGLVQSGFFIEEPELTFGPSLGAALGISVESESLTWTLITEPTATKRMGGEVSMQIAPIGEHDDTKAPDRVSVDKFLEELRKGLEETRKRAPTGRLAGIGIALPSAIGLDGEPSTVGDPVFGEGAFRDKVRKAAEDAGFEATPAGGLDGGDLHVDVINDADADLLYESRWGKAAGRSSALGVKICANIGGAVLHDGQLVRGANGRAGEIGHVPVKWQDLNKLGVAYADVAPLEELRDCYCVDQDCVARFANGRAIIDTLGAYRDRGSSYNQRGRQIECDGEQRGPHATRIRDVFGRAGELLGRALTAPMLVLDPEVIVVTSFPRNDALPDRLATGLRSGSDLEIPSEMIVLGDRMPDRTAAGAARLVVEQRMIPLVEQSDGVTQAVKCFALPWALRHHLGGVGVDSDADISQYVRRYSH
jgi:predicted NBD/HSP70 family sugar kinase